MAQPEPAGASLLRNAREAEEKLRFELCEWQLIVHH